MTDRGSWSDETTADPLQADERNFYKMAKWTRDGLHVERCYMPSIISTGSGTFSHSL